jgi:hypothetical protein
MAQVPDEAKELRLVNNVELKIALADTDAQLQRLLNLYLTPLLMKLGSPHAAVRNKVIRHLYSFRSILRSQLTVVCVLRSLQYAHM